MREQGPQLDQSGQMRLSLVLTSARQNFSYLKYKYKLSPGKVNVSVRVIDTPSSLVYFPIQVTGLIFPHSTCRGIKVKYSAASVSTLTTDYFTVKVIEAFVTILDKPRASNSVGFSCPWIFSDFHFRFLISKIIVK